LETAWKWGAESSGDERDKNARESKIVIVEFNKSLREANLCKQSDFKSAADLAAYLHDMGFDTGGNSDGKKK